LQTKIKNLIFVLYTNRVREEDDILELLPVASNVSELWLIRLGVLDGTGGEQNRTAETETAGGAHIGGYVVGQTAKLSSVHAHAVILPSSEKRCKKKQKQTP
jgi:hypothetical protein